MVTYTKQGGHVQRKTNSSFLLQAVEGRKTQCNKKGLANRTYIIMLVFQQKGYKVGYSKVYY